jgi:hypothetical protein
MAGRGPAPKDPGQRRRYNQPARGEWVDLEPLEAPILPGADDKWSGRVKRLWVAWREDPVTSQYGPADLAAIWDLAEQFDGLSESTQTNRMDRLGLTPKGKRDLRWRTVAEAATIAKQGATVRRLHVVAK